jgi:acyl dehydratase
MLLYGMDGDPEWDNRQTRFLAQAYVGDELEVEYYVSNKREERTGRYGILSIDIRVKRVSDGKLILVSHRNLYRIKK